VVTLVFRHGVRSYEIIDVLLSKLFPGRADLVVVDLTYGVGRFYRLCRGRIARLIAVDTVKHVWEVEPDSLLTARASLTQP
jgi:hypothetical protein